MAPPNSDSSKVSAEQPGSAIISIMADAQVAAIQHDVFCMHLEMEKLEKKLDAAVLSLEPKETTLEAKQETQNSSVSAPQIPYGSFYLD